MALTANLVCEHIAARATHFTLLRQKGEADAGALLGATIPFVTSAAFNPELVRDVSDDLKWGTLSADKVRANLFLEQYLMMCLWHACRCGAASISWRASYPLSMHGRLQEEFIAKVQTLTAGLCTHCYRMPYETYFCSESEAVGFMMMDNAIQSRFLRGVTINDETGFFCLDIGGGSTDFSLWAAPQAADAGLAALGGQRHPLRKRDAREPRRGLRAEGGNHRQLFCHRRGRTARRAGRAAAPGPL